MLCGIARKNGMPLGLFHAQSVSGSQCGPLAETVQMTSFPVWFRRHGKPKTTNRWPPCGVFGANAMSIRLPNRHPPRSAHRPLSGSPCGAGGSDVSVYPSGGWSTVKNHSCEKAVCGETAAPGSVLRKGGQWDRQDRWAGPISNPMGTPEGKKMHRHHEMGLCCAWLTGDR